MSATNKTTYYELPVFIATDEPKWLTDWNGAMNIIDAAIAEAKTAGDNAQTTANANALAISGLSDSVSTISTALGTLTTTVNTINGTVNTITELIGNGTPTTTDKTIIGAINELKAEIDALAPGGEVAADDVTYDNTDSGLTATNVQDAIDELAQGGGAGADLNFVNSADAVLTAGSNVTIDSGSSSIQLLSNTSKSIGKVYGGFACTTTAADANNWHTLATITANTSVIPTISEAYNINYGFAFIKDSSNVLSIRPIRMHFNTDASIEIQMYNIRANDTVFINLAPCVLVLKNLGD